MHFLLRSSCKCMLKLSSLGLYDKSSFDSIDIITDLDVRTGQMNFTIRKIMNIVVRTSYIIFAVQKENGVTRNL